MTANELVLHQQIKNLRDQFRTLLVTMDEINDAGKLRTTIRKILKDMPVWNSGEEYHDYVSSDRHRG